MFFKKARAKKAEIEKEELDQQEFSKKYEEGLKSIELNAIAKSRAETIVSSINRVNRELSDMHDVNLSYNIFFSTCSNEISVSIGRDHYGTCYDLKQIKAESYIAKHALCFALEILIREHLRLLMPKDRSGTEYTLTAEDHSFGDNVNIRVLYSAKNGLFRTESQREEETANWVDKYINNPVTIKAANTFSDMLIKEIKQTERNTTEINIKRQYSLAAAFLSDGYCKGVLFYYGDELEYLPYHVTDEDDEYVIDFDEENLKPIETSEKMCAFVKAISILAQQIIKDKYPHDEYGSQYSLNVTEFKGVLDHHLAHYGYIVCFDYIAPNANYIAPKEW